MYFPALPPVPKTVRYASLLLFTLALGQPAMAARYKLFSRSSTQGNSVMPAPAVTEATLPNGLKIVIREDHRSPVVMTQVWYRVGSVDEPARLTGISHVLEHMMFKGTRNVPGDRLTALNSENGGSTNAFTTHSYTAYYQMYPANYLDLSLQLEADRMQNLELKQNDFEKELKVVMEERRQRTDDNPKALAYERFLLAAYPTSPLRSPVIGHMNRLAALKLDDLKKWYDTWYSPNNATLVVVGDVNPQQVIEQATRHFGNIPARPLPVRASADEFYQTGERNLNLFMPVQVPALTMAFNVPSLTTAKTPAEAYQLALLQSVLDGGASARLEKKLVREKNILTAVSSGYDLYERGGALFTISAIPGKGVTLAQARQAILDELDLLKKVPVTQQELDRSINSYIADNLYARDDISEQAYTIGILESIGLGWKTDEQFVGNVKKIRAEQLQQTAQNYFNRNNLTTLYLAPESAAPAGFLPATAGQSGVTAGATGQGNDPARLEQPVSAGNPQP